MITDLVGHRRSPSPHGHLYTVRTGHVGLSPDQNPIKHIIYAPVF